VGLTQSQLAIVAKARSVGGGEQGVALTDETCAYLVAVIARDLDFLPQFPEIKEEPPAFFGSRPLDALRLPGLDFLAIFERLLTFDPNTDTYFACLAALHKARLKYEKILQTQPVPTVDQVGPRGLLQYGSLRPRALTPFLLWRKWIYDIDNRAGQETGYLFEPIIAYAIGGVPVGARKSPVRRQSDKSKGRQVDCIREKRAHEIKIRVTIAASGQGRWREELEFPADCKASGFVPVLVVLDPTANPKVEELKEKFFQESGEVHIGPEAWGYLESLAGRTMSRFLERYVQRPIEAILAGTPAAPNELPEMKVKMDEGQFIASLMDETLVVERAPEPAEESESEQLPDGVDDEVPGP